MKLRWLAVVLFHLYCTHSSATTTQPNIVVILADDLGWSDTGAYGNTFIDTPNIDQLARDGLKLTRFYANPVCSPSRAAIQSGMHATRLGITDFISPRQMTNAEPGELIRGHWRPFEKVDTPLTLNTFPDVTTVADQLSAAGYRTAYFGKWHLGFEPGNIPSDHGYQVSQVYGGHTTSEGESTLALIGKAVEEFLVGQKEAPFFLFLSTIEPHIPLEARPELLEKYRQRGMAGGQDIPIPVYAAVVEELDSFVGAIRQKMQQHRSDRPTVFIFLSDNGGLENYDLDMGGRVTSNAPLRGEKGTVYEGGIRVPFIMEWQGKVKPNTENASLAAAYDLYPTLLEIAGIPFDGDNLDGRSLMPALTGATSYGSDERTLYFHYPHYHHDRPASVIITSEWKLIEFLDTGDSRLYYLADDPGEQQDVSAQHPDKYRELMSNLEAWRENVGAKLPTPNPAYDPARAGEWWHPGLNKKIDTEFLRRVFKVDVK